MRTVFIDSSVLISACYSKIGGPALILGYCRKGKVKGYISQYVVKEAKKNIAERAPQQAKQRLNEYLLRASLMTVEDPSRAEIHQCEQVIKPKDAIILAAAVRARRKCC